jgi:DNA invertase Pin-like site-specific DNA recombinase
MDTADQRLARARVEGRRKLADAPRAAVYCRLSVAAVGDTTKVEDQERISRELAKRKGWRVAGVYADNNKSAWQPNRNRPGWDQMLKDVEAGLVDAIVVYHGDRLVRQPLDLETLFQLAKGKGIRLASPTGTRDLDNDDDQYILTIEAAAARRESASISRRKKAGFERMAREGRAPVPGGIGGRAFGYRKNGRIQIPREAAAVRMAADRVIAGEALATICRDLAARGITSTTGHPLMYAGLKRILLRPRTAGLLSNGEPGKWKPLITPAAQQEVKDALALRGPKHPITPAGSKHLLSGIALCWACRKPVQITNAGRAGKGVKGYACVTPGCRKARRNAAHLDAHVIGAVCGLLSSWDFGPVVARGTAEGETLHREIAMWERRLTEAQETLGDLDDQPAMTTQQLLRRIRTIQAKLRDLRAREVTPRQRMLASRKGITPAEFHELPLYDQRQLVAACFVVTILAASRRGPGFNPGDVEIVQRGEDE